MEQNQVIVIEPESKKKPIGMQIAALIMGIVGFVSAYFAYFGTFIGNIMAVGLLQSNNHVQSSGTVSAIIIVLDIILALFCLAALILGIVGLVRSIRRPTRTVKGIVLSAVGISGAQAGLVLTIIGMVFSGALRLLISSGLLN